MTNGQDSSATAARGGGEKNAPPPPRALRSGTGLGLRPAAVDAQQGASNAWMMTFVDLVLLMLTFFVLLFSMTTIKQGEWSSFIEAIPLRPEAVVIQRPVPQTTLDLGVEMATPPPAIHLAYLQAVLDQQAQTVPSLSGLESRLVGGESLWISLPLAGVFTGAESHSLAPAARPMMADLAGVLANISNRVEVLAVVPEGYRGPHVSPWELAVARAAETANALRSASYPGDIAVSGRVGRALEAPSLTVVVLTGGRE